MNFSKILTNIKDTNNIFDGGSRSQGMLHKYTFVAENQQKHENSGSMPTTDNAGRLAKITVLPERGHTAQALAVC